MHTHGIKARLGRRGFIKLVAGGFLSAALLSGGYGARVGVEVERREIRFGIGVKALFVSDLHLHSYSEVLVRLEELEKPELIIVGGDTYDRRTRSLSGVSDSFSVLSTKVVAVLGNHEHWCETRYGKFTVEEGVKALERGGVLVLRDEVVDIGGVRVQGLDWRDDYSYKDVDPDNDLTIVHTPDAFVFLRSLRVLAGHTHGGQICLPGQRPIYTNSFEGFYYGFYAEGPRTLFVSKGLGEMYPPRIYCRRDYAIVL